jgi:Domain of unknown function (DUF5664)
MPELTEGTKHDGSKVRLELFSPWFIEEVGMVLTEGAIKYDDFNWAKGISNLRLVGATLRHVYAYMRGERDDPEFGLHHLAHAACCLMFLIHQDLSGLYEEYNNMPKWQEIVK